LLQLATAAERDATRHRAPPRVENKERGKGGHDMLMRIREFYSDESGQDLAEYGLLLALIALVVLVAVRLLGSTIRDFLWGPVSEELNNVM
jgi:pilus assembly protein Flp/PilA